jgi:hypothetical protein
MGVENLPTWGDAHGHPVPTGTSHRTRDSQREVDSLWPGARQDQCLHCASTTHNREGGSAPEQIQPTGLGLVEVELAHPDDLDLAASVSLYNPVEFTSG